MQNRIRGRLGKGKSSGNYLNNGFSIDEPIAAEVSRLGTEGPGPIEPSPSPSRGQTKADSLAYLPPPARFVIIQTSPLSLPATKAMRVPSGLTTTCADTTRPSASSTSVTSGSLPA